uniref:ZP domain-containing protein n=1 Tax=Syphacia muris TaxID=451379 RepID=A0A0N5AY62_9BILA
MFEGEPEIVCGHNTIKVKVKTENKYPSYIFAKGHFRDPKCSFQSSNNATFTFEHCNINRKREVNPRGMAYSLTVIVQLHPLFITKVDRAYNVRCFYVEEDKEVNAEFAVSDLVTTVIESGNKIPECTYTLHRDSPNGPVLRYARVGDLIYHVWECPSNVYAMFVHTCSILDGHGDEHIVVDKDGCSIDDYIIPQLTYSNDLTRSFTGANVVNLPDSESVYFNCQIKLCLKGGDYCSTFTPPKCHNSTASKSETIEEALDSDQLFAATGKTMLTYLYSTTSEAPITEQINKSNGRHIVEFTTEIPEGSGLDELTVPLTITKSQARFKKSMKAVNDEVVDVDVSTPELRIIESELGRSTKIPTKTYKNYYIYGLSDFAAQQNIAQTSGSVCLPLLSVWVLTLITIVAVTVAFAAVYRSRSNRQKLSLAY